MTSSLPRKCSTTELQQPVSAPHPDVRPKETGAPWTRRVSRRRSEVRVAGAGQEPGSVAHPAYGVVGRGRETGWSRGPLGAGEGNRTLVCSLEGCRSTIELHPQGLAVAGPEALPQLVRSLFVGHTRDRALERVLLTMGVRAFGHGLWPSDHARLGPCQATADGQGPRAAGWWREQDSNLRRLSQRIYSPSRLTAPESRQE